MKNITDYKIIFWDFDGVIMDSMPVRDQGFLEVLKGFPPDEVDQLMSYHRANGGLSRYAKFRYLYETIKGESVTEERILELAGEFSKIMLTLLVNEKLLIRDSVDFIRQNFTKQEMHVVSGSDGTELKMICNALQLAGFFGSINGSPTPKNDMVKNLIAAKGYKEEDIVLIGDSGNDLQAAQKNGIDFFGYNNLALLEKFGNEIGYIHSFSEIN